MATWPIHRRQAVQLLAAYAAIVVCWVVIGLLVTGPAESSAIVRTDERFAEWFVPRRTQTWDTLTLWGSGLAETWVKALVTGTAAAIMVRVWRRWYEAVIVAGALIFEAAAFLAVTLIVGRDRPDVPQLDASPIGSSFPSGHVAAAVAYAAFATVVFRHTRNRLARSAALVVCTIVPLLVGLSRMYRGMHFLTDVVAGALLGGASVWSTVLILRQAPECPSPVDHQSGPIR